MAETSFEEARNIILSNMDPLGAEDVELLCALRRVTATAVVASRNLPPFDNSAMDGYAVRLSDCHPGTPLPLAGYIPAGGSSIALTPGCAIKIMTGAPVPPGCDAIVPLEEAEESGDSVQIVGALPSPGQHIRCSGEDVRQGAGVLPSGTAIGIREISMLASLGLTQVRVYRQPLVAILATGDELVEPHRALTEGKIFNSNSAALAAAVWEAGAMPKLLGIAPDSSEGLREKISEGLKADMLITAAGVSVGDRDLVRETASKLGVQQLFWKVNIKPGKSMAFGMKGGVPVFSLPGNPVSAMVTFEELVRPALLKILGHRRVIKPLQRAILQEEIKKKAGQVYFSRVRLKRVDGKCLAWSSGSQDTGVSSSMLRANALAVLPADRISFAAGEEIGVHVLSHEFEMLDLTES